jgi:hypothetical protein
VAFEEVQFSRQIGVALGPEQSVGGYYDPMMAREVPRNRVQGIPGLCQNGREGTRKWPVEGSGVGQGDAVGSGQEGVGPVGVVGGTIPAGEFERRAEFLYPVGAPAHAS